MTAHAPATRRCDAAGALTLDRPAARPPGRRAGRPRRVLVLSVYRPGSLLPGALATCAPTGTTCASRSARPARRSRARRRDGRDGLAGGKFENLNGCSSRAGRRRRRLAVVVDDDVGLPPRFLDRFLAICERARPRPRPAGADGRSHAAWRVTRRRPWSLARATRYVEIGPVTAFGAPRRAGADAVPGAALRLGARQPLGRARPRARLAARRGRRPARPPRVADGRDRLHPRRGDRRGAPVPRRPRPTSAPRRRSGRSQTHPAAPS